MYIDISRTFEGNVSTLFTKPSKFASALSLSLLSDNEWMGSYSR